MDMPPLEAAAADDPAEKKVVEVEEEAVEPPMPPNLEGTALPNNVEVGGITLSPDSTSAADSWVVEEEVEEVGEVMEEAPGTEALDAPPSWE